ncbi:CYFA0S04e00760g1_1 [Cyberlindnera fabianii]|uniref:CYFA0S04e00760g1_1 n=1 Tax=Cyberlindnera fabianii TaxID=36022 RepID=A0A061AYY5_CYBFA|nr:CYFA0S04e00760g1_1 [Cyberlindnera fabianii]
MEPDLPQGAGYAIIIGLGLFFALLMNLITWIQNKYTKTHSDNVDEFTTSSRNVPFGLICCGIVSSWTWSLTLLQSATESYTLGICGSYYYGIGGLAQVSVFSAIAAKVKANANLVTTFPEMGYFRFGTAGHLAFMWCALVCNSMVSACILIGGSAVVNAVTGVDFYASIWLISFVCAIYVFFGGLRATFIADAIHTFILLIFIMIFAYTVYTGDDSKIGSPKRMVELLTERAETLPVEGNYHGSYLTFRSKNGVIYAIQTVILGFGLVNCDQAYWSRAIASRSKTISSSYFCAACCWFIIPVTMGLTLGLGARALSLNDDFPSLSDAEISAGLSAVAAAGYVLGKAGSTLIVLMVFLSVTSSYSGELIASSTLMSYDVYKKYIKPDAKPHQVVNSARISVFLWFIYSAALTCVLHRIGISLGWLFNFLGVATASGVFPIALTFLWKDLNTFGAVGGSVGGMFLALIVWLVTCKTLQGEISVDNLATTYVAFAGNAAAIILGGVIAIVSGLIWPANFDFDKTRNRTVLSEHLEDHENKSSNEINISKEQAGKTDVHEIDQDIGSDTADTLDELPQKQVLDFDVLDSQYKRYIIATFVLLVTFTFVIPIAIGSPPYIFSTGFLTLWVVIMYIWLFGSFSFVIIYPLVEARTALWRIAKLLVGSD